MVSPLRPARMIALALALLVVPGTSAFAADPPYQGQLQRLLTLMGSLYYLQPLCGYPDTDWRGAASELIDGDVPDEERRSRLVGAFNAGYQDYERLHMRCTASAVQAMRRFLAEGDQLARDIRDRYTE